MTVALTTALEAGERERLEELGRLQAEHLCAWNEGRTRDCVRIIQQIRKLRGDKAQPVIPTRLNADYLQGDYDERRYDARDKDSKW